MNKYFMFFLSQILILTSNGQETPKEAIANTPAKSALSYETLTQFFQANISSGKNGGFNFKSTLFGIEKFFSKDSLNRSSIYLKDKIQRNLEFNVGLNKGKAEDLSLLGLGIKYALINHRDKSEYNFLSDLIIKNNLLTIINARSNAIAAYRIEIRNDETKKKELREAEKKFHKSEDIKDFPQRVQDLYNGYLKQHNTNPSDLVKTTQDLYDLAAKKIDKRLLLTLTANPQYDFKISRFDSTYFSLQLLQGFGNPNKPWNIDVKASHVFGHDSTKAKYNLSRYTFIGTLGLNKVLIFNSKLDPLLEFELAYELNDLYGSIYQNENRLQPKFVSILRVHLTKEITLPLTAKYDKKNHNLFGIFRVQWDLESSSKN
jgi:hypothetical protein